METSLLIILLKIFYQIKYRVTNSRVLDRLVIKLIKNGILTGLKLILVITVKGNLSLNNDTNLPLPIFFIQPYTTPHLRKMNDVRLLIPKMSNDG